MKVKLYYCLLVLILIPFSLVGQDTDIVFKGNYQDIPFGDFVEDVEQKTGLSFYYQESWTRGVRVTASGEEISLRRTLDLTLLPAGLYYHIERTGEVYLSDRQAFIYELPD